MLPCALERLPRSWNHHTPVVVNVELPQSISQMKMRFESIVKDCSTHRTRKKTPSIWERFNEQVVDEKYICNYCSRELVGGGRIETNKLIGHHKAYPRVEK